MKSLLKYILAVSLLLTSSNMHGIECEVPICVIVDKGFANVTPEVASAMNTQLQRLATQSNLNIGWKNARFALTAKLDQVDRYIVDGAPAQIVNVFGVTLYIADIYNQKMFTSTYTEIKGVGTNDTKAAFNAIRQLNKQNGKISTFMQNSKQQIINYYNGNLPTILKEAKVKASMKNYGEALAMIAVIPSCCNQYDEAMEEAQKIYVLYRDVYFQAELNKAKALWASNPTVDNSKSVAGRKVDKNNKFKM